MAEIWTLQGPSQWEPSSEASYEASYHRTTSHNRALVVVAVEAISYEGDHAGHEGAPVAGEDDAGASVEREQSAVVEGARHAG